MTTKLEAIRVERKLSYQLPIQFIGVIIFVAFFQYVDHLPLQKSAEYALFISACLCFFHFHYAKGDLAAKKLIQKNNKTEGVVINHAIMRKNMYIVVKYSVNGREHFVGTRSLYRIPLLVFYFRFNKKVTVYYDPENHENIEVLEVSPFKIA